MRRIPLVLSIACVLGLSACGKSSNEADQVFYGSNIITMDEAKPSAEAVAIQDEKIVYVGDKAGAEKWLGDDTRVVELGERALIPGFIDSHGHIAGVAAMINFANIASPPVGPVQKIDDILAILSAELEKRDADDKSWLIASGYDDSLIAEMRHPTRDDLDKVSKDVPIYLMHVSGHLGTANSAALAEMGIDENMVDPDGGVFRRYPGSQKPNGVMEEEATHMMMGAHMLGPMKNPFNVIKAVKKTMAYYASYGVTTIQDGGSDYRVAMAMKVLDWFAPITMDVVVFQAAKDGNPPLTPDELDEKVKDGYSHNVRLGGVKLMLDGSPQGRTSWMTQPYNENPEGIEGPYVAYPTTDPDVFKAAAAKLLHKGVPILVHANGDAAIDLVMDAVDEAFAGQEIPDHRSVIIHSQVMRPDQVVRAAKLKMVPSFFSSHTFFWGDWHRKSFGEERAAHISPTKAAKDLGVNFTIHNDSPVVPSDMMRLIWATVNRETRSGFILGPDQRLSPYDALYAATMGGAYQYFEEDKKGSLTVGKQADLVVLGENPLTVDPKTIKDIPIVETIAHGKTVYQNPSASL
ncbi:amidohydrolase [Spongiibacter sp. KMU-158]|uniref:Amidohydrolase n=1 Tax=Spongiibacter pelagi TaxID=2760804 RepID=A0A927GV25_9GAMM|nr:amidohydrolase [Spongiibacter pelagi]MBD2857945.1 amidohydrolase [Spongiibacter pelagi]